MAEPEGGGGQPACGQRAIEHTDSLSSPDDAFEHVCDGTVVVVALGVWRAGQGEVEQWRKAVDELPADAEECANGIDGRQTIEAGVHEHGELRVSLRLDHRGGQHITRREVGVDGLTADAGSLGDLVHAGVGPLDEDRARRLDDRDHAALGVGASSASTGGCRGPGGGHSNKLGQRQNLDKLSKFSNSDTMSEVSQHVGRPRYGVDAPLIPAAFAAAGTLSLVAAARWRTGRVAASAVGAVLLANSGCFLHTSVRGKHRIWRDEFDRLGLAGDEELLDLGCGRGAVLIEAARRLPRGRAVGADLWTSDQSGNRPETTIANAEAAGVADRVDVHTADMASLPFADDSFDVVTSAMAIHNIPSRSDRHRALDEAVRVLRPGGQLLIADVSFEAKRYAAHLGRGTLRPLGSGYWYGGPWFGVSMLHAVKERGSGD